MQQCLAYIRVSTPKQGKRGVSLQEQRAAIERFAQRNNVVISQWFEERETAAKRGRPVFNLMLKLLRKGRASGVVIHKIDRSARNLKDWADLGELIDQGIEVFFANESLDLRSRGGRLSADIQAVVAADYIRNLREETRKGFYGRLKQGISPIPAPIGYLDGGPGKTKKPDPVKGPLVRKAFELYASARYSIPALVEELWRLGLRNRNGRKVSRNGLANLLRNPFYVGLIRLKSTHETFAGIHEPLIKKSLFDRVQLVMDGKLNTRTIKHEFLFRRLLQCKLCKYSLIGERQKGHVYYRCHIQNCQTTAIREEVVEQSLLQKLSRLQFSPEERRYCQAKILDLKSDWKRLQEEQVQSLNLQLSALQDRLVRLTDAYIDRMIDQESFAERKSALLQERRNVEERLAEAKGGKTSITDRLERFLELAESAYCAYKAGVFEEKRDLLETLTSNRLLEGKNVEFMLKIPFDLVANRFEGSHGGPTRTTRRTWDDLLPRLSDLIKLQMVAEPDRDDDDNLSIAV